MTNIWPLFVWSQPGQRMSRSPGLMGSTDVRQREGDTVYWAGESLASEDQRCDCCDIPLMSPVMCGPGWVRPVSLHSIIMDIMTSRLNDQYKATKRLDSYLLSQFKSWMSVGTTTILSLSPTARPSALHRVDTDSGPDTGGKTAELW